jgi:hypothetical protein
MAAAQETEASKIKAGLIDPKALEFRSHEASPLAALLDDFQAALLAKGGTDKHAGLYSEMANTSITALPFRALRRGRAGSETVGCWRDQRNNPRDRGLS